MCHFIAVILLLPQRRRADNNKHSVLSEDPLLPRFFVTCTCRTLRTTVTVSSDLSKVEAAVRGGVHNGENEQSRYSERERDQIQVAFLLWPA